MDIKPQNWNEFVYLVSVVILIENSKYQYKEYIMQKKKKIIKLYFPI